MNLLNNDVAIHFIKDKSYLNEMPFDPPEAYPEYQGKNVNPRNRIYAGIRDLFIAGLAYVYKEPFETHLLFI